MNKLFSLVFFLFLLISADAQYIQLIPSTNPPAPGSKLQVPNYGTVIKLFQEELKKWADIKCQEALNKQFSEFLEKERSQVKVKTVYVVAANITSKTNCKIETFRPLKTNEKPAIIHDDSSKYILYTIEVYPWIVYNGRRY